MAKIPAHPLSDQPSKAARGRGRPSKIGTAHIAEIRQLAATMSRSAIAKQLGLTRWTVSRVLGWRSMPEPASVLPAPPEQVYLLITARTTDRYTIRRRIDLFCRAIPDRAFAKDYRRALLAIHRAQPDRPLPAGLPAPFQ